MRSSRPHEEEAARSGGFATYQPHESARAVVAMCTALAQWFRVYGLASAEHPVWFAALVFGRG